MNSATLLSLYLFALQPSTIDPATFAEMLKDGHPTTPDTSAPMFRRAVAAGPSVSERILRCYHPSATLTGWRYAGTWFRAWEEGADHAAIMRIDYRGLSGQPYKMDAAITGRLLAPGAQKTRVFLLSDTAILPAKSDCEFNRWQAVYVDRHTLEVSSVF
jgi:hypothetical protein